MKKIILMLMAGLVFQALNAQNLKVMTYNIRLNTASDGDNAWPHRKDLLVNQIKFHEPDIFGTQEGLPEQVAYIDQELPDYAYIGRGRDAEGGEHTALYFKQERFKLLESHTFWLSETPDKVSKGWDAAFPRICTYGLFLDKDSKKHFWAFNTHLDHRGEQARKESIKIILAKIGELNAKNYPVILMGDFNVLPESEVIQLAKEDFVDAEEISVNEPFGPAGTFNGFNFEKPAKGKIDYILIRKPVEWTVVKHAVLSDSRDNKYPSDHFPVFAEIDLSSRKKK